ncbi:MAG: oligosaccharide flippase family protein [Novosphingobium sp.]|uniref:lipopolysaccharide biosynthesis protein n=1 Tax=Novosphingobium sp. TaxID=1874826 RepID=UPI003C7ACE83
MRTGIKVNIAANLLTRSWNALMSFIFVPVYLRLIGAEGFGFISLYTTLAALFVLLDFGLALTANREIARYGARADQRSQARAMLRTFEAVYWVVALVIGGSIALMAGFVVHKWISLHQIPLDQAERGIQLMGLVSIVRWPVSLYSGALQGMQRQVTANIITAVCSTAAGAGAVLILWLVARRVDLFVAWQVVIFAIQVVALRMAAWHGLTLAGDRPRARLAILRQRSGFSLGVMGITLLSLVLTQLDKLLLTRLLTLKEFGYYSIASSIAGMIAMAGGAVQTAAFPALTSAVEQGDVPQESEIYHTSSRMLAVLVMPVAITLVLFAPELLAVYLHDAEGVSRTRLLLAILALGYGLLALNLMPYSLQLAHGWTSLSIGKNVVAVVIYVPLLLYLVPRYGALGAALSWVALTSGYLLLEVPVMHRRLLRDAKWRWYFSDLGQPFAIAISVLGLTWLMLPADFTPWPKVAVIVAAALVAQLCCLLLLPDVRALLSQFAGTARIDGTGTADKVKPE